MVDFEKDEQPDGLPPRPQQHQPPPAPSAQQPFGYPPPPPPGSPVNPYQQSYQQPYYAPPPPDEVTPSVLAHVLTWGVTFFTVLLGWVPALVVMMTSGQRSALVRQHAVTELNAWITALIYYAALSVIGIFTLGIGFVLMIPLAITYFVYFVLAVNKATKPAPFQYPTWLAWPMVS
jgi:uncharacterized membrane protein